MYSDIGLHREHILRVVWLNFSAPNNLKDSPCVFFGKAMFGYGWQVFDELYLYDQDSEALVQKKPLIVIALAKRSANRSLEFFQNRPMVEHTRVDLCSFQCFFYWRGSSLVFFGFDSAKGESPEGGRQ